MMMEQRRSNVQTLHCKLFDVALDLEGTDYRSIEMIGFGAYGAVCCANNVHTGQRVAVKRISNIFDNLILAKRTYREIKILQHFKHDNIIAIQDLFTISEDMLGFRDVYIVFDLMETDLHRVIHSMQELSDEHIRYFLYQLLRGLKYIHSANILHRDLKPANLLVNENCDLKIGDFGMARPMVSLREDSELLMTHYVATRWYRSPELILFRQHYTAAVDVWSVGCILAEMIGRKPIFPGRDLHHQITLITSVLGSPTDRFIDMAHTDRIKQFLYRLERRQAVSWNSLFPSAPPKATRLLGRLLMLDPRERVSVEDALADLYLNQYHDLDDEPCCTPTFRFDFEEQDLDSVQLKQLIYEELVHGKDSNATCSALDAPSQQANGASPLCAEARKLCSPLKTPSNDCNCDFAISCTSFSCRTSAKNLINLEQTSVNNNESELHLLMAAFTEELFEENLICLNATKKTVGTCNETISESSSLELNNIAENKQRMAVVDIELKPEVSRVTVAGKQSLKSSIKRRQLKDGGKPGGRSVKHVQTHTPAVTVSRSDPPISAKSALRATLLNPQRDFRTRAAKLRERLACNDAKMKQAAPVNLVHTDDDKKLLERWTKMQPRNKDLASSSHQNASEIPTSLSALDGASQCVSNPADVPSSDVNIYSVLQSNTASQYLEPTCKLSETLQVSHSEGCSASLSDCNIDSARLSHLVDSFVVPADSLIPVSSIDADLLDNLTAA